MENEPILTIKMLENRKQGLNLGGKYSLKAKIIFFLLPSVPYFHLASAYQVLIILE